MIEPNVVSLMSRISSSPVLDGALMRIVAVYAFGDSYGDVRWGVFQR